MMLHWIFMGWLINLCNATPSISLLNVVPGDTPYYKFHEKFTNTNFIIPPPFIKKTPKIVDLYHRLDKTYQQSFDWYITNQRNFVFASSNNQTPNAFATLFPLRLNYYYWGGVDFVEYFASRNWLFDVVSHELAHMYQMDPHKGFGKFSTKVFGHSPIIIYPLIPVWSFPYPNALHPTWILEGNGVLNESRFGAGGRLYSAEFKALFNVLIKDIPLDETRINNTHLEFPFGTEKYVLGAFFNLFLANQFGVHKVNSFFKTHAKKHFNPFEINDSFSTHFGISYSDLIQQFLQYYRKLYAQGRTLNENPLTISISDTPLNSNEDEIFFLTQETGMSKNTIWALNRETMQTTKHINYYFPGKVFKYKNTYATRSVGKNKKYKIQYGLWASLGKRMPKTKSKYFVDIKLNHELYIDVKKNYETPHLVFDKESFGPINSHALISFDEKPLFFIQKRTHRILYHGQSEVFSYKGFYGKLVDTDPQGNVYFIANTQLGSSLYKVNINDKICYEVFASDRIIDARLIKNEIFLIREIVSTGFSYKIVHQGTQSLQPKLPYWDEYFFEKEKDFTLFDDWKQTRTPPSAKKEILPQIEKYNSAKHIQFSQWSMTTYLTDNGFVFDTNFMWTDPVLYNQLNLGFENNQDTKISQYRLEYSSARWRIMPFMRLQANYYDENPQRNGYHQSFVPEILIGARFPYAIRPNMNLTTKFYHDGVFVTPNRGEWISGMKFRFTDQYFLSFDYNQYFDFEWEYAQGLRGRQRFSTQTNIGYDFNANYFLALHGQYSYSSTGKLIIGQGFEQQSGLIPTKVITFYEFPFPTYKKGDGLEGVRLGMLFKPAINFSLYSQRIPLSLRRFAPMFFYNGYWGRGTWESNWRARPQWGTGVSWELLAIHNFPIKLNTVYIYQQHNKDHIYLLNLNLDQ